MAAIGRFLRTTSRTASERRCSGICGFAACGLFGGESLVHPRKPEPTPHIDEEVEQVATSLLSPVMNLSE